MALAKDVADSLCLSLAIPNGEQVSCVAFSPSHSIDDGDVESVTIAVGHNL